jgi:ABC-2 type transport system ATP-binding protein
MNAIDVSQLTYRYGRIAALRDVEFAVPTGALYALLGPNGSGKTTLLQILMGLRRPLMGRVSVFGGDIRALTQQVRASIGYVAEGQALPQHMRLREIEAYLAPLYDTWDAALARNLRERFALDPARKIRTLSRGEQMKAALLCALAPRPRLLIMDEPFTGMDALVKDELVRGLLESSGAEGWTVLLCSQDIGELEMLADWVGFLEHGSMRLSQPMDALRDRFKHVDVTIATGDGGTARTQVALPPEWMCVERSGSRLSFITSAATASLEQTVTARLGGAARVEARDATLREVFIALAKAHPPMSQREVAA